MSKSSTSSVPPASPPEPAPLPPPKLARLPEGALPPETPKDVTQAENRLRFWARQNGYTVKVVHTHRLPDINTYFVILEGPKE